MSSKKEKITAAEAILRSLSLQGVEYLFANYGTDHTPLIEAAAKIRRVYNETPSEWWPRNFFMWVVKTNDEITQKVEKMK